MILALYNPFTDRYTYAKKINQIFFQSSSSSAPESPSKVYNHPACLCLHNDHGSIEFGHSSPLHPIDERTLNSPPPFHNRLQDLKRSGIIPAKLQESSSSRTYLHNFSTLQFVAGPQLHCFCLPLIVHPLPPPLTCLYYFFIRATCLWTGLCIFLVSVV